MIDQLVEARLLVVQTRGDAGGGSVEIVHESLIERWPTLRRWLDENQEDAAFLAQLAAAAKQWDAKGRADRPAVARRRDGGSAALVHAASARAAAARARVPRRRVRARPPRPARQAASRWSVRSSCSAAVAAGAMVALFWIRGAEQQAARDAETAKHALIERDKKDAERQAAERRKLEAEAETKKAEADKQQVQVEKAKSRPRRPTSSG